VNGLEELEALRQGGFSEDEVATHVAQTRATLSDAGYSEKQIDEHYGIKAPDEDAMRRTAAKTVLNASFERHRTERAGERQAADFGGQPRNEAMRSFRAPGAAAKRSPESAPVLDYFFAGFENTALGMVLQGAKPSPYAQQLGSENTLTGTVGGVVGDLGPMVAGALGGGLAGSPVGPAGTVVGAGAGSNALPVFLREAVLDAYEHGGVQSWSAFWERYAPILWDTSKAAVAGGAGAFVGGKVATTLAPAAGKAGAETAGAASELATMVTAGKALEGEIPSVEDFKNGAILLAGLKGSRLAASKLEPKLKAIWKETGRRPNEVLEDLKSHPELWGELADDTRPLPRFYEPEMVTVPETVVEAGRLEPTGKVDGSEEVEGPGAMQHKVDGSAEVDGPGATQHTVDVNAVMPAPPVAPSGANSAPTKPAGLTAAGKSQRGSVGVPPAKAVPRMEFPTAVLWKMKDFDRRENPSSTDLDNLKGTIERKGFDPNKPITITISKEDGLAYITDGNNRLTAAHELGLESVPTRIIVSDVPFTAAERAKARPIEDIGLTKETLPEPPPLSPEQEEARRWLAEQNGGREPTPRELTTVGDAMDLDFTQPVTLPETPLGLTRAGRSQRGSVGFKRTLDPASPEGRIEAKIGTSEKPGTSFDDMYTATMDDLHPLRVLEREMTGGKVESGPYDLARLTRGAAGKAQQWIENSPYKFDDYTNTGSKPLRKILEPVKKDIAGFRAYAVARRAAELHQRNIESGFDPADVAATVGKYDTKYRGAFDELVEYQNHLTTYLRDAGIISPEAFDAMVDANKSYVPFYRLLEGESSKGPGKGMNVFNPIKAIKGSDEMVVDPIESIIKNTYAYIALAERNAVGQSLVDLAGTVPNGADFVQRVSAPVKPIDITPEVQKFLSANGLDPALAQAVTAFRRDSLTPAKDEIVVYRAGQREVYKVNEQVAEAFKATDRDSAKWLATWYGKIAKKPAELLRAGTVVMPDFVGRNMIRDQASAFIFSDNGYIPFYDMLRGALSVGLKDESYQAWLKGGGANAAMVSIDRNYIQSNIFKLDAQAPFRERAWNVVTKPVQWMQVASELMENATRVGEFKRATKGSLEKGISQKGAFASREVTLDFGRIGAQTRALNQISAFFNAHMQGLDRTFRAFKDNPTGSMLKTGAAVTLPSVLLWWANHEDPRYQEIPQWERDLYWHIFTDEHIYRIPKPHELGLIFGSAVERSLDALFLDDPRAGAQFGKSMAKTFIPSVMPTVAGPMLEQTANHSFFADRPLVPSYMEGTLPEMQYTPYTTELTKAVGSMVAAVPYAGEKSIASPIVIDNYIRNWTGGLGVQVWQLADKGLQQAGVLPKPVPPTATLADIPVIRAFVTRYPSSSSRSITDFEARYIKGQQIPKTISLLQARGEYAKAAELQAMASGHLAKMRGVNEALANMRKTAWLLHQNPAIAPDEKRQLIDSIYFGMIELSRGGLKAFDAMDAALDGAE
jgi:hypothetical protein